MRVLLVLPGLICQHLSVLISVHLVQFMGDEEAWPPAADDLSTGQGAC